MAVANKRARRRMVRIAVELDHEPPVHPDQIDFGPRSAHRIDEPVEAEQFSVFSTVAEHCGKPLLNLAQRVRCAAPGREPGFRAARLNAFRLGNGKSAVGVGYDAASAMKNAVERRVEGWQLGEQGD